MGAPESMSSLRRLEGYLLIDHSASPGTRGVPEGKCFESPTVTCSHCQTIVVLNALRTRSRGYCSKCDAYICDGCTALGECRPFMAQYTDKPNVILSVAGAPARTTPSGLMLPGHITR